MDLITVSIGNVVGLSIVYTLVGVVVYKLLRSLVTRYWLKFKRRKEV